MNKVLYEFIGPFRDFFSEQGVVRKWLVHLILIQVFILIEYSFQISSSTLTYPLFIIYGISFLLPISVELSFHKNFKILRSMHLWILIGSVTLSLYLFDTQRFYLYFIKEYCPLPYRYITYKIIYQLAIWIYFLFPYVVWKTTCYFFPISETPSENEANPKKIKVASYLLLVIPMLMLVMLASFSSDFRSFYPIAPLKDPLVGSSLSWQWILLFEITYILAFVATEWFFRRFLIQSFSKILGRDSIMLVTYLYVAVHFQKPILETISSSFGGFALGILAFYTGQIRGGIILHVSIAIAMEIMGFYWISKS